MRCNKEIFWRHDVLIKYFCRKVMHQWNICILQQWTKVEGLKTQHSWLDKLRKLWTRTVKWMNQFTNVTSATILAYTWSLVFKNRWYRVYNFYKFIHLYIPHLVKTLPLHKPFHPHLLPIMHMFTNQGQLGNTFTVYNKHMFTSIQKQSLHGKSGVISHTTNQIIHNIFLQIMNQLEST